MGDLSRDEVKAKLATVFREVFDDDGITLEDSTTADDVAGWDSMNQVRLLLAYEGEFGIHLKAKEVNALANVGELVDYVHDRLQA